MVRQFHPPGLEDLEVLDAPASILSVVRKVAHVLAGSRILDKMFKVGVIALLGCVFGLAQVHSPPEFLYPPMISCHARRAFACM